MTIKHEVVKDTGSFDWPSEFAGACDGKLTYKCANLSARPV